MAPNSHHLIQISIVEEYRIFRTINLDKNDDFVYSTKNVSLYFVTFHLFSLGQLSIKKTQMVLKKICLISIYLNNDIMTYNIFSP
jgi:hypothetical protein